MALRVMTVTGPIPPERTGFTLPHEHTAIARWHAGGQTGSWQLTADEEVLADELGDYRRRGGGTLVDVTPVGFGRDPRWLRGVALRSGVQIVMGCGWYTETWYPPEARIDQRTADDLAAELVAEFRDGVAGTGVRPGIIGEIGTDRAWLSAQEERVHRAAARAARETGMAITTHALRSPVGRAQLALFEEEGADPSRVVIGHADSYLHLDHYLAILDRGANLQFDLLGHRDGILEHREPRLIEIIVELLERGHASQLLLSQDVGDDRGLKAYGGFGYVYLQQHFLPSLRTAAVGEGEITQMTVENPRRILTVG